MCTEIEVSLINKILNLSFAWRFVKNFTQIIFSKNLTVERMLHLIFAILQFETFSLTTWFLVYFKVRFYKLQQAETSSSTWGKNPVHQTGYFKLENCKNQVQICGRHLVDMIGDISWTKEVTSHGHFWWHFVDTFVHEKSSFWVTFRGHFWVTFRGHFLGEFLWPFIKQLTNPNLTQT